MVLLSREHVNHLFTI